MRDLGRPYCNVRLLTGQELILLMNAVGRTGGAAVEFPYAETRVAGPPSVAPLR